MRRTWMGIAWASAVSLLITGAPAGAQVGSTDAKRSEERGTAVVRRMAEFLARAERFSVTVDIGFDVVQAQGEKIEFGETRHIVLRRPDRLRVDETRRSGEKGGLVFDGRTLTVFSAKENVYATDALVDGRRGTVDQAIEHLINGLDMRLPLAEWLDTGLPKMLQDLTRQAAYVEPSHIAGVPCDHVALRGDDVDLQVWVAQGDQPLPRRVVITHRRDDGRPQFRAQFSDWNLAPPAPDSLFVFTPPAGAVKISFGPGMIQAGGIGGTGEPKP